MTKANEKQETYLGFDFGLKNIGVAIGQTVTKTASPLPILRAKNGIPQWQKIAKLIKEWKPKALIVGVPFKMDAAEFDLITEKAKEFAKELEQRFNFKVYLVDERLTTKAARQFIYDNLGGYKGLKTKPIDSFAAKIILESWMNGMNEQHNP